MSERRTTPAAPPNGGPAPSGGAQEGLHQPLLPRIEPSEEVANSTQTTGMTTQQVVCLVGYALAFVVFGSQVSVLGPTIKPLSERLGCDETDLSPLFTALGISCIISGTPSGWLVDRVPTHVVLVGSLIVEAIGFSLVPLMTSVWSLTTLYFLICFSYNFTNSAVFSSLVWLFPGRAGGALNLVLAMFGVGSFLIPIAAQLCALYAGDPLVVFWCIAATSVLAMVPFAFVTSPSKPQAHSGDGDCVTVKEAKTYQVVTTVAVVSLVFLSTAAETAIGNWLFTYCSKEMGLGDNDAALTNSMFWAAFTVGRVVGVILSPYLTPGSLLISATPFSVAGASIPILFAGGMTKPLIIATAVLCGFGNSTGYANAVALLERYVPVTGFINGIFGAVAGAACMVGPTLVAMLIKYSPLGYQSMAWVGLCFYALHFPAIMTAVTAGEKAAAVAAAAEAEAGIEYAVDGTVVYADGTPAPDSTAVPVAINRGAGGYDVSGRAGRRVSSQGSVPGDGSIHQPRLSLGEPLLLTPGHFPPNPGSLARHAGGLSASRRSNDGFTFGSLGGGGFMGGFTSAYAGMTSPRHVGGSAHNGRHCGLAGEDGSLKAGGRQGRGGIGVRPLAPGAAPGSAPVHHASLLRGQHTTSPAQNSNDSSVGGGNTLRHLREPAGDGRV